MRIAILGATGRTGRRVLQAALAADHAVSALTRRARALDDVAHDRLTVVVGDATDAEAVDRALAGADVVISALGHTPTSTPDVLAVAARHTVDGARRHGVGRIVALTSGATGRTGRRVLQAALAADHVVSALTRRAGALDDIAHDRLTVVVGDATDADAVDRALAGADVVISALGHTPTSTPDVLAVAARHTVDGARRHGVGRIVALTSGAVVHPADRSTVMHRVLTRIAGLFFGTRFADARIQAETIRNSGLDHVLVRATSLTDEEPTHRIRAGYLDGAVSATVPRGDVAAFMFARIDGDAFLGEMPLVSRAPTGRFRVIRRRCTHYPEPRMSSKSPLHALLPLPALVLGVVQAVCIVRGPTGSPPTAVWVPYMWVVFGHLLVLAPWLVSWRPSRSAIGGHIAAALAGLALLTGAAAVDYAWYDGAMETNVALAVLPGLGLAAALVGGVFALVLAGLRRVVRRPRRSGPAP